MRYVLDIDETTGKATFQQDDKPPIAVRTFDVNLKREPVVNEKKTAEGGGFVQYDPGPKGLFTLSAELDYLTPVNNPKI